MFAFPIGAIMACLFQKMAWARPRVVARSLPSCSCFPKGRARRDLQLDVRTSTGYCNSPALGAK